MSVNGREVANKLHYFIPYALYGQFLLESLVMIFFRYVLSVFQSLLSQLDCSAMLYYFKKNISLDRQILGQITPIQKILL